MLDRCDPACLFNVTADPGETQNLFSEQPALARSLMARLEEVGRKAPPPCSYWDEADLKPGLERICDAMDRTGFLEPVVLR